MKSKQSSLWLRQWHGIAVLLFAVVALAGLCQPGCSRSAGHETAEEAGAHEAAAPVPVQATTATSKLLQPAVHLVGRVTLDPTSIATLSAPMQCVVQSIAVTEGQHVAPSALLVQMDPRKEQAEAEKGAAVLAKSRATLDMLKAGPRAEDIEVARQDLQSRQVEAQSAQEVVKGKAELRQKDVISTAELEEAHRKLAATQAAVKSAQAKLNVMEKGPRPEEIAQAEAEYRGASADEVLARFHLEHCRVTAPIEGNVAKVAVHPGMALDVGAAIAEVIDLRRVLIETVIPLSRLADLQLGATAQITSTAYPNHTFEGKVVRIGQQAAPETGDLPIWIGMDNPEQFLRKDMVVRVTLHTSPVQAKVVIPEVAVIELEGQLIAITIRDGKTHNAPVTLGHRVDDMVEVVDGLAPGDQVITSGGYGLPENHPVTVTEPATQPAASQPAETASR